MDKSVEQAHNFALQFLKDVPLDGVETVLDVGCGRGYQAEWFANKGKNVTGVDFKKYRDIENVEFIEADITNLPLPDSSFDLIWTHHVLEHVLNPMKCLFEMRRVLKDSGWLYFTVPQIDTNISSGHINSFNMPVLIYKLAVAGFDCKSGYFKKVNSHLRCAVQNNPQYNPNVDDVRYTLSAVIDSLPECLHKNIRSSGRYYGKDLVTKWLDGTTCRYN